MNATRNLTRSRTWRPRLRSAVGVCLAVIAPQGLVSAARPDLAGKEEKFHQQAKAEFRRTREHYQSTTNNVEAAWKFGRAAFDLAEFARTKSERESLAAQGVAACRRAVQLAPDIAPGHYYLGLNLGQLARVYLLKGLGIVAQMEEAFLAARKIDPLFDFAGADRALGLLYHQAPGWPLSLGSQSKAARHLRDAVRLQPNYPGNRIALVGYLWETRQKRLFLREWEALMDLLPGARQEFAGQEWELSWIEWDHRLDQIRSHAHSLLD